MYEIVRYPMPQHASSTQRALTPNELQALEYRIRDAEQAYHKLMTGTAIVSVQDQNGERMQFSAMNKDALRDYITAEKLKLPSSSPLHKSPLRPLTPFF